MGGGSGEAGRLRMSTPMRRGGEGERGKGRRPGGCNLSGKITISVARREECVTSRRAQTPPRAYDINLLIPARPRIMADTLYYSIIRR